MNHLRRALSRWLRWSHRRLGRLYAGVGVLLCLGWAGIVLALIALVRVWQRLTPSSIRELDETVLETIFARARPEVFEWRTPYAGPVSFP